MSALGTIFLLYGFGFVAVMTVATMLMMGTSSKGKYSL